MEPVVALALSGVADGGSRRDRRGSNGAGATKTPESERSSSDYSNHYANFNAAKSSSGSDSGNGRQAPMKWKMEKKARNNFPPTPFQI